MYWPSGVMGDKRAYSLRIELERATRKYVEYMRNKGKSEDEIKKSVNLWTKYEEKRDNYDN